MRHTFIIPLLHLYTTSPVASSTLVDHNNSPCSDSPIASLEHLPIASRFLWPVPSRLDTPNTTVSRKDENDANMDTESTLSDDE
jgi:hypothetical protein